MWRRCVLTVLAETNSSAAISGALRLLGRYRTTRSSASLSSSRSGAVVAGRRGERPASTSRIVASSAAWAVRCLRMALQQLADGHQHERQDDPVRLGELERALDRRLGRARSPSRSRAAASSSSAWTVAQRGWSACSSRRRRLGASIIGASTSTRLLRAALRQARAPRRRCASRPPRARRRQWRRARRAPPPSRPSSACIVHDPAAHVESGARARARARLRSRLRGAELRQRFLEPALPEPHEGPRVVEHGLRLELSAGRLRSARPGSSHCSASSKRPSHASAAAPAATAGARIRCVPHPCASAIATASSLSRSPSGIGEPPRTAASARWPRQPTSRYGRPMRRASASASSRSRRASSSCSDHSSAMPRFIRADARWSLLRATSSADRASNDRIACRAVARSPR